MMGRPQMLADSVSVNIRMERCTRDALAQEAKETGASVSSRIRRIIEEHFDGKTPVVPVLAE